MGSTVNRRIELDFLRGIAILLVLGVHFSLPATGVPLLDWIEATLKATGGTGVNLFFALSGFLVGGLLLKEYATTKAIDVRRFLIRRAFKIWPMFYVLVFVHLLIGRHERSSFFWQNVFQVQNYVGSSLRHTWSLAVEEHFYLFLSVVLFLLVGRSPRVIIRVLGVLCVCAIALRVIAVGNGQLDAAFRQTHLRLDSLLYGVILAALQVFYPNRFAALARQRTLLVACVAALLVFIYMTAGKPVVDRDLGFAVQGIGFSLLILLTYTASGRLVRQFWYRAIAWIGVYSYGIYLFHTFALQPGSKITEFMGRHGIAPVLAWFAALLAQIGIALAIGVIMTRAVEWPSLQLRERLFGGERFALGTRQQSRARAPT